ncbi:SDR family NAD(P)-dependent oxidoreductase [Rhizosaccharibacter radicis]|uniref:SDR family NAD(P)-dependent oxidoreductase n=1 Tax=Rhizosaccharibacter radicis TaxID=2782605 RepID=A0ABT1VXY0_9PROT|nr:SDR family NAD(P)-dependent oxidoreductase [Acetobacteraceae bacterium KSS12]
MSQSSPRIALVTGASSGFGRAIAQRLVADGIRVIATARRRDRLDALRSELGDQLLPLVLDVTDAEAVAALPGALPDGWREVDVLVANAGLALGLGPAHEAKPEDWARMIATNVSGVTTTVRALLPGMVARDRGHVITIGSIAGTYPYPGGNVYGATKAFVAQFALNLRADLVGTGVRVSNLEPGLVGGSEFSNVRFNDDDRAAKVYENAEPLLPEDIAETVSWVLSLPARVNINRVELMPVTQASAALAVKRKG